MQKRLVGYSLIILGFGGMALSGYLFATGNGGRVNLLEVTGFMIIGAISFFAGINFVYAAINAFSQVHAQESPELDEVSPIQQQWRTIHIAKQPVTQVATQMSVQAV
jgi:hypothetical protein